MGHTDAAGGFAFTQDEADADPSGIGRVVRRDPGSEQTANVGEHRVRASAGQGLLEALVVLGRQVRQPRQDLLQTSEQRLGPSALASPRELARPA